jgi:hypothetical protein
MYGSVADFVSTRPDIIANQPNFNKMQVRNGRLAPHPRFTRPTTGEFNARANGGEAKDVGSEANDGGA